MRCKHSTSLDIAAGSLGATLVLSDQLLNVFANPTTQTPRLITFLGSRLKTQTVRKLLKIPRNPTKATVHIHSYPKTVKCQQPILIADYTTGNITGDTKPHYCHETLCQELGWYTPKKTDIKTIRETTVLARLILPFTDVLCIYLADFHGIDGVTQCFKKIIKEGLASKPFLRPRVLVVTERSDTPCHYDLITTQILRDCLHNVCGPLLEQCFSSINVVCIPRGKQHVRVLMEHLEQLSEKSCNDRQTGDVLFSLTHFAAFFKAACSHFSRTITAPFDFVRASRFKNPVPQSLSMGILRLLSVTPQSELYRSYILIASCFMLDCVPPGMHSEYSSCSIGHLN